MRKIAFLFLIGVLVLTSCGQNNQYKVSGDIDGVSEGEAVLQKFEATGPVAVDTAEIVDGSFSFTGTVENPELYLIKVDNNQMPIAFFLEQGDISISANVENLQEADVKGAALNAKFNEFNDSIPPSDRIQELQQEFMTARQSGDQEKMQQLAAEFQAIRQKQEEYYRDFVFDNSDNVVGAFLAMNMATSLEVEKLEELVTSFEANIPEHPYLKQLNDVLEAKQKQQAAKNSIQVGNPAPGFTLTDMDGNEVSLEDFQGKYVLLDFWASWCKPCRNENPNMVKAYEEFGGDSFEIVGVSLDKTSEPWLKAVEEDNITWTQVHDPEGDVANTYGVQSIPFTLLLDEEGVIVEKNLRGEALQEKLQEVL